MALGPVEGVGKEMILVDLEVPSMRKIYQFQLEENCPIDHLIAEIVEIIEQKEHCCLQQGEERLELCSREKKCVLNQELSLAQQQIREADYLILL